MRHDSGVRASFIDTLSIEAGHDLVAYGFENSAFDRPMAVRSHARRFDPVRYRHVDPLTMDRPQFGETVFHDHRTLCGSHEVFSCASIRHDGKVAARL